MPYTRIVPLSNGKTEPFAGEARAHNSDVNQFSSLDTNDAVM
jgi:hypothetical protein